MQNQTIYLKKIRGFYFPIVIVLYLLLLFLKVKILILIFGLPLFLLLPGYQINKILRLDKYLGRISFFGFSLVTSVAFVSLVQVILRNFIPLSQIYQIGLVLGLNLVLWLLALYLRKEPLKFPPTRPVDFVIAFIPLLFFILRFLINPYLIDTDGALYVSFLQNIAKAPKNVSFLIGHRFEFFYHGMLYHLIAGIGFIEIFKFAIPAMVWMAFISFYDICKNWIKNHFLSTALYLAILVSPALTTSIDRSKPETFIFLFLFPAFILYAISIERQDWRLYLLGLLYAFVGLRVHETGLLFLFSYLLGGVVGLKHHYTLVKKYLTWKNAIFFLIIVFPYLIIFNFKGLIAYFLYFLGPIKDALLHFQWRWWFLGSYESLGFQLGWPGFSAIYFYFYNGAPLLLIFLLILFFKQRILTYDKKFFVYAAPILIFFGGSFIVGEILPRIGFSLLPDRIWVHLFYSGFYLFFIFLALIEFKKKQFQKILGIFVLFLILTGSAITIAITVAGGSLVSRAESKVLDYINKIPDDKAVIISTQNCNETMIRYYTDKLFALTLPPIEKDYRSFRQSLLEKAQRGDLSFSSYGVKGAEKIIPTIEVYRTEKDNKVISETKRILKTESEIIGEESKYRDVITGADKQYPIYLLYSLVKTKGLLAKAKRQYWLKCIDYGNRDFFAQIKQDIVYQDSSAILFKIR